MYKTSNWGIYIFIVSCQFFQITPTGCTNKAKNMHVLSNEQYFSKHGVLIFWSISNLLMSFSGEMRPLKMSCCNR